MSLNIINAAWKIECGSSNEKLVLLYLASNGDQSYQVFRSTRTIGAWCHISRRRVQDIIARLEDAGHITVKRPSKLSRGLANAYRLLIKKDQLLLDYGDATSPNESRNGSKSKNPLRGRHVPSKGTPRPTFPLKGTKEARPLSARAIPLSDVPSAARFTKVARASFVGDGKSRNGNVRELAQPPATNEQAIAYFAAARLALEEAP